MPTPATVRLRDQSGAAFDVAPGDVAQYIGQGFTPETDDQGIQRVTDAARAETYGGITGGLAAGAAAGLSGLTLGASDVAFAGLGLGHSLREYEEQNPYLSLGANFAGALAPALLTAGASAPESAAGVGARAAARIAARTPAGLASRAAIGIAESGAERGAVGKIAGIIAGGATEGALQNAGAYVSDVALGNRDLSGEAFAASLGDGALWGGAGAAAFELGAGALGVTRRLLGRGEDIAARRLFPAQELATEAVAKERAAAARGLGDALTDGDTLAAQADRTVVERRQLAEATNPEYAAAARAPAGDLDSLLGDLQAPDVGEVGGRIPKYDGELNGLLESLTPPEVGEGGGVIPKRQPDLGDLARNDVTKVGKRDRAEPPPAPSAAPDIRRGLPGRDLGFRVEPGEQRINGPAQRAETAVIRNPNQPHGTVWSEFQVPLPDGVKVDLDQVRAARDSMLDAMKEANAGRRFPSALHPDEEKIIRDGTQAIVDAYGLSPRLKGRWHMDRLEVEGPATPPDLRVPPGAAAAIHASADSPYAGMMLVTPQVMKEYADFLSMGPSDWERIGRLAGKGDMDSAVLLSNAHVINHETVHAHGPALDLSDPRAQAVEELTTELAARRITANAFDTTAVHPLALGAYGEIIDPIVDGVAKAAGFPRRTSHHALEAASLRFKQLSGAIDPDKAVAFLGEDVAHTLGVKGAAKDRVLAAIADAMTPNAVGDVFRPRLNAAGDLEAASEWSRGRETWAGRPGVQAAPKGRPPGGDDGLLERQLRETKERLDAGDTITRIGKRPPRASTATDEAFAKADPPAAKLAVATREFQAAKEELDTFLERTTIDPGAGGKARRGYADAIRPKESGWYPSVPRGEGDALLPRGREMKWRGSDLERAAAELRITDKVSGSERAAADVAVDDMARRRAMTPDQRIAAALDARTESVAGDVNEAAEVIGRYEAAHATLVEATQEMGLPVSPGAVERAEAFREAQRTAQGSTRDATARAAARMQEAAGHATLGGEGPVPRNARGSDKTVRERAPQPPDRTVVDPGASPAADRTVVDRGAAPTSDRTVVDRGPREWDAGQRTVRDPGIAEEIGVRHAAGEAAGAGTAARAGGYLQDAATIYEALTMMGAPLPNPGDIPVIGPLLSIYLRARLIGKAFGRYGGRVGATTETAIAARAAAVKQRVFSAVDAMLDGASKAARAAAPKVGGVAAILGRRLFDAEHPRAKGREVSGAGNMTELYEARAAELVAANQRGAIRRAVENRLPAADAAVTDPVIAAMERQAKFLLEKMPKPFTATFLPGAVRFTPSKAEMTVFARYVNAATDPASVLERIAAGGVVTVQEIDTLKAVYPELHAIALSRLLARVADQTKPVPYGRRKQVGALFGIPLDPTQTPQYAAWAQQGYVKPPPAAPPGPTPAPGLVLNAPMGLGKMTQGDRL